MIRHQGQGPGRTPAEADASPTLPLEGADTRDPGTEPTVPLEAGEVPPRPEAERTRYVGDEREHTHVDEHRRVDLARLAWLGTVGACLIAVAILVVEGYYGYAAVTFAVAASAALNLT
jgi:hypothetical protein